MEPLYGPPPATLVRLLDDPEEHDFPAPRRILDGLSGAQATIVPPGLPYSVAQLVAHMLSNMRFNLGLMRAADPFSYDEHSENWPLVTADEWPVVREEFFRVLQSLVDLASQQDELSRVLYPESSGEPAWTVGYKLALSVAKHNAYHLGQIIVIRRVLGLWSSQADSTRSGPS